MNQGTIVVSEVTINGLFAVFSLFGVWNIIILYVALVTFLWDREEAIRVASGGRAGGHNPIQMVIHATLILLTLTLGTASAGELIAALTGIGAFSGYTRSQQLNYASSAFFCLTSISFFVSAFLLHSAARRVQVKDSVA